MGIRMWMGPSIPPHGHGSRGERSPVEVGWVEEAPRLQSIPEALGTRPLCPPQKAPAAGAVQRAGAVQAVTASLLCREQREAGFKADRLKLFF